MTTGSYLHAFPDHEISPEILRLTFKNQLGIEKIPKIFVICMCLHTS